jgi:ubiquinone/menaquinone biosynthesis C-methylase UbiE
MTKTDQALKQEVHDFWDRESCGTNVTDQPKFSRAYFDEIEAYRYQVEPEIPEFAQFPDGDGKRVLEVGIGAGTDFLQWVRGGARVIGMDYTREAIKNVSHRLTVYEEEAPLLQADAENLPFCKNSFDLVYSWGVIHHTPGTWKALDEIIRLVRPGGRVKLMLYNRHSVCALAVWIRYALFAGKPWRSVSWALHHHVESLGTKGYTLDEIKRQLHSRQVSGLAIKSLPTFYDRVHSAQSWKGRGLIRLTQAVARVLGWHREGWFILIEFTK